MSLLPTKRIPRGWTVEFIGGTGEVRAGRQRSPHFKEGDLVPYLRVANVFEGRIDTSDVLSMRFSAKEIDRYRLKDGDILLNEGQSLSLVGRCAMVDGIQNPCCFQNTLVLYRAGERVHRDFALHYFQFCYSTGRFSAIASRTTSIAHLGVDRFARFPFLLPPLPEQEKIAEILSEADGVMAALDEHIAAAEQRKKGLAQRLLSGETRFPEFKKEPWDEVRLGDVGQVLLSSVDKKSHSSETPVLLCNYMDVFYNDYITGVLEFMKATATAAEIEKFTLQVGDVMLTKDSETREEIAFTAVVEEQLDGVLCGYHMALIKPKKEADGRFLSMRLRAHAVRSYFVRYANGATRYGLTVGAICNAPFTMPPTKDEQLKIASVIKACDDEIELLKQQRAAYVELKRGLMQVLLTGKVRVKVDGEGKQ